MDWKAIPAACKRLYERYYAWKHRPPTPTETAQAKAALRTSLSNIEASQKAYGTKGADRPQLLYALNRLTDAAYHLRAARRLDPDVYVMHENEDGTMLKMTTDYLAAEILHHESWAERALYFSWDSPKFKQKAKRKALRAAEKSVQYQPNVVPFLQQLARCQNDSLFTLFKARRTMKKALALDPNNAETLAMLREQFRLW